MKSILSSWDSVCVSIPQSMSLFNYIYDNNGSSIFTATVWENGTEQSHVVQDSRLSSYSFRTGCCCLFTILRVHPIKPTLSLLCQCFSNLCKKNSTSIEEINSSYTIFSLSLLHCVFFMLQNPYPTKSSQWPHICWACQSHEIYISTFSYYLFYKLIYIGSHFCSTYVYIAESRTNIPDSLCVFVGNLSFLTHSRLTESKSLQIAH